MNKIVRVLINLLEVLLLLILIFFNFNNVSAVDENGFVDEFSYEIINGEAIITGLIESGVITEIPSEIDGYPVIKIGYEAFLVNGCYYDDLIIPEGVREIEIGAFCEYGGCTFDYYRVRNITIPKSVTKIGLRAIGYARNTSYIYDERFNEYIPYYNYFKISNVIIRGHKGTAAETYAKDNGFTFIALDDEPITTTPVTTDITTTETTVVTTQTTPITTIPDITENIIGDVNGDGKLTASDAAFIAKTLAEASINNEKIEAKDYPIMDFNQDGKITAKDAADIARYLAEQLIT